jgi:hypothetical protein
MSRRFIPLARSAADPEAIIRERFKRISRDALVAHASTDALRRAHHEAMGVAGIWSPRRHGAPKRSAGGSTRAGSPQPEVRPLSKCCSLPTASEAPASGIAPARA